MNALLLPTICASIRLSVTRDPTPNCLTYWNTFCTIR